MLATAAPRHVVPAAAQQRLPAVRQFVVVASAATKQQQGRLLVRCSLLLGAGALAAGLALQHSQMAAAQDWECDAKAAANGVKWCDIAEGFGPPVVAGERIRVHYEGKLANGDVFDTTYGGAPLAFRVGSGESIKGWDMGILGGNDIPPMKPGGRRRLVLQHQLALGARGAPPETAVVYDITFLGRAQ